MQVSWLNPLISQPPAAGLTCCSCSSNQHPVMQSGQADLNTPFKPHLSLLPSLLRKAYSISRAVHLRRELLARFYGGDLDSWATCRKEGAADSITASALCHRPCLPAPDATREANMQTLVEAIAIRLMKSWGCPICFLICCSPSAILHLFPQHPKASKAQICLHQTHEQKDN